MICILSQFITYQSEDIANIWTESYGYMVKSLVQKKKIAVEMRKNGLSYNDILKELSVAKSTLSLWLKDLPLTKDEEAILEDRKNSNISRGRIRAASALHNLRLERDKLIQIEAEKEFKEYIQDPLFQIGLALYWAEGSKRDTSFGFTNSDAEMVKVIIRWIGRFFHVYPSELSIRLYTHKPFAHELFEEFWSEKTGIPIQNFRKTIYKLTTRNVKKRPNYKGCIRITLSKAVFLKKVLFWQELLIEKYS